MTTYTDNQRAILTSLINAACDVNGATEVEHVIEDNMSWSSVEDIAEDTGLSVKTVRATLSSLSKRGLVGSDVNSESGEVQQYLDGDDAIRAAWALARPAAADEAEAEADAPEADAAADAPEAEAPEADAPEADAEDSADEAEADDDADDDDAELTPLEHIFAGTATNAMFARYLYTKGGVATHDVLVALGASRTFKVSKADLYKSLRAAPEARCELTDVNVHDADAPILLGDLTEADAAEAEEPQDAVAA